MKLIGLTVLNNRFLNIGVEVWKIFVEMAHPSCPTSENFRLSEYLVTFDGRGVMEEDGQNFWVVDFKIEMLANILNHKLSLSQ